MLATYFASAKEVMFFLLFVFLLVNIITQKFFMDFEEIFRKCLQWDLGTSDSIFGGIRITVWGQWGWATELHWERSGFSVLF